MILSAIVTLILGITSSFGGSPCLPRNLIYPCICTNVPVVRKQVSTVVTCHGLRNSDELSAIFNSLRSIEIDKFLLYDSFWEAHLLGDAGDSKKVLPGNWMKLLKIKEMEIVDTPLSSKFACGKTFNCKNTMTTRLTAVNSTSFEEADSLCPTGKGNFYPWTSCMQNLTYFHFSHGKLTSFGKLFLVPMQNLLELNLTHNRITRIEPNIMRNLRNLSILDLSHNAIEHLDGVFEGETTMNLKFLDVSWNFIKTIGTKFFPSLPRLKHFKAEYNRIGDLNKEDWINIPNTLKIINLNKNLLHCGCNIRWMKEHIPRNVTLLGLCTSPKEYENVFLRVATNAVNKKYDEHCNLKSKKIYTTVAV
ncbi:hypothetical protein AVEN_23686-1 [Araneus ventricosus]|uniref:Uncharacterized protein n=1 Tax=Araneus ventricosus TaxID=182803 RepID=A0A4Y2BJW7_ARAVE|nr:hypothetical protein AVEN_23686-1 [Araneus ventricosus]